MQPAYIKLHASRAKQLQRLAATYGPDVTLTEVLEKLIGEKIEEGILPDELPGFDIEVSGNQVMLYINDLGLPAMNATSIAALSWIINDLATGGPSVKNKLLTFADQIALKVYRQGGGYVMAIEDQLRNYERKASLTGAMMTDLARQLAAVAKDIKAAA